jgi:FtsZ-binding cell division protein ZapB
MLADTSGPAEGNFGEESVCTGVDAQACARMVNVLSKEVDVLAEENDVLAEEVDDQAEKIDVLSKENDGLVEEVDVLAEENEVLSEEVARLQGMLETHRSRDDQLNREKLLVSTNAGNERQETTQGASHPLCAADAPFPPPLCS